MILTARKKILFKTFDLRIRRSCSVRIAHFTAERSEISRQKTNFLSRHVTPVASPTGFCRFLIGSREHWMPCILIFYHPLCLDQNPPSLYLHVISYVYPKLFFCPPNKLSRSRKKLTCCSLRLAMCVWRPCNFFWRSGFCETEISVFENISQKLRRGKTIETQHTETF